MLIQFLLPMLRESFSEAAFSIGENPLVTFPAAHSQVGELRIFEVGREGRVEVGDLMHGHFYSFGSYATREEAAQELAENIFDFVIDLFAEHVVLWRAENGNLGGWFAVENQQLIVAPVKASDIEMFYWTGPTQK